MSCQRAEALADHTGTLSRELAAERERRLEAELQVEQLREVLERIAEPRQMSEDGRRTAAIDALHGCPPPSLDPLRELVRAVGCLLDRCESPDFDPASPVEAAVFDAADKGRRAVLALYPFLREAEGEVKW